MRDAAHDFVDFIGVLVRNGLFRTSTTFIVFGVHMAGMELSKLAKSCLAVHKTQTRNFINK